MHFCGVFFFEACAFGEFFSCCFLHQFLPENGLEFSFVFFSPSSKLCNMNYIFDFFSNFSKPNNVTGFLKLCFALLHSVLHCAKHSLQCTVTACHLLHCHGFNMINMINIINMINNNHSNGKYIILGKRPSNVWLLPFLSPPPPHF